MTLTQIGIAYCAAGGTFLGAVAAAAWRYVR